MTGIDLDDLILTIAHPFGSLETSLAGWMATGPGPRPMVRPVAVRSRSTGEQLPLTRIPLEYRNDAQSKRMISEGIIEYPWKSTTP